MHVVDKRIFLFVINAAQIEFRNSRLILRTRVLFENFKKIIFLFDFSNISLERPNKFMFCIWIKLHYFKKDRATVVSATQRANCYLDIVKSRLASISLHRFTLVHWLITLFEASVYSEVNKSIVFIFQQLYGRFLEVKQMLNSGNFFARDLDWPVILSSWFLAE